MFIVQTFNGCHGPVLGQTRDPRIIPLDTYVITGNINKLSEKYILFKWSHLRTVTMDSQ
jgi:hypothetical protein